MEALRLAGLPEPDARLALFDLSVVEIHNQVIFPAMQSAANVSPLAPKGARGRSMYDTGVQSLRSLLLPKGWSIAESDNVARTVQRDRGIAIVFSKGNASTGLHGLTGSLTTRWPKGSAAFSNARSIPPSGLESVDPSDFNWFPKKNDRVEWELWYLLYYPTESEIRLELSAPTWQDTAGYPRGWNNHDRILFPPIPTNPNAEIDDEEDAQIPDVPVEEL